MTDDGDKVAHLLCPCCDTEVTGPDADTALRQHCEACSPLTQPVAKSGHAGLQLALLFSSWRSAQQFLGAIAQEVASTSISKSARADRQRLHAARVIRVRVSAASASFKSLVS